MASKDQISANRLNSQKSTGPNTQAGKAIVRHNARRHGLLSRDLVIEGESAGKFDRLRQDLFEDHQPEGREEEDLVELMVVYKWRLYRCLRAEPLVILSSSKYGDPGSAFTDSRLHMVLRYETTIERAYSRVSHELERLRAARRGELVTPPITDDLDVQVSGVEGTAGTAESALGLVTA